MTLSHQKTVTCIAVFRLLPSTPFFIPTIPCTSSTHSSTFLNFHPSIMPEYWFVSAPGEGNRTVTFQNFKAKIASSQNDLSEVSPLPIPEFKVLRVCMNACVAFNNYPKPLLLERASIFYVCLVQLHCFQTPVGPNALCLFCATNKSQRLTKTCPYILF